MIHQSRPLKPLLCVGAVLLFATPAISGPPPVEKAKRFLTVKRARLVAFFAHPTCRLLSVRFQEVRNGKKGFTLIYRFDFVSLLDRPFYSKLALEFDIDGNYRSIDHVATTSLVDPFAASEVSFRIVKNKVEKYLKNVVPKKYKEEVKKLMKKADVKGLLKVLLVTTPP